MDRTRRLARGQSAVRRTTGLTLLEMLVVLAILGAALGLVALRGAWHSDSVEVRAAADTIADALRATRAAAFRTGRPADCRVDPPGHLVRPARGPALRLPPRVSISFHGTITFQPDGAGTGGRIETSEGRSLRRIDIDWLSGRISIAS